MAKKPIDVSERLANLYSDEIDRVDKKLGLSTGLSVQPKLPSGVLVLDWIFGGSIFPGMTTILGMEAGGKSTAAMTILRQAIKKKIPIIRHIDAENAVDPNLACAILRVNSLEDVYGIRDSKTGKWIIPPKARYTDSNILEDVFKSMHHSLNRLPDKVYRPEREEWFLVFDRDRESTSQMKALGLPSDPKLYTETGRYWVSLGNDDRPQAFFIVDSYPALVTNEVDEEESEGNALALEARSFSKYVKRVTGKLRKKAGILLGVNQIRESPMNRHGPGFTEPGGKALQFFSSHRSMFTSVVPEQGKWDRDSENGMICVEPSVEVQGATDRYMFKNIRNLKNKSGTPYRKGKCRVWIEDGRGRPRGIDPVFDTFFLLDTLGLIEGNRKKKFTVNLPKLQGHSFTWNSFKEYILAEEFPKFKPSAKLPKFKLRAHCRELLANGTAETLYQEARKASSSGAGELEDIEEG